MGQLAGRVAIVTGAARGLGRAFAEALLAQGCSLVITDRDASVIDVADEIGATGYVGDVADPDHVSSVVDASADAHGRIDILINNAGEATATGPRDSWEQAERDFDRAFDSNVKGAFLFGRAVAPLMTEAGGGDIVNISTDHVHPSPQSRRRHGHGGMDLYNASKWALNGLTFDWAIVLRKYGVRVNALCLGAADTEMLRSFIGPDPDPAFVATWMQPADVASVLIDLLEEGPDGRTGDSIGLYAGQPCVLPPPEPR
jgi:NAD(P)-dependent dehydrogenase (short-subunit alcohol dehydrogenase family)